MKPNVHFCSLHVLVHGQVILYATSKLCGSERLFIVRLMYKEVGYVINYMLWHSATRNVSDFGMASSSVYVAILQLKGSDMCRSSRLILENWHL